MQLLKIDWRRAVVALVVGGWCAIAAPAGAEDFVRKLQVEAEENGRAEWGHWGTKPDLYHEWSTHSSRLIPVYTYGMKLDDYRGVHSPYRSEERLKELYGRVPEGTLNPDAEYFDQTDIYRMQKDAAAAGKKHIFLFVFDGMDWTITRAAAIHKTGKVAYDSGRGSGLYFQDYRDAETDFGYCVTVPHNEGTKKDVDSQTLINPGGTRPGGFDPRYAGDTPWATQVDLSYLTGRKRDLPHPYPDSAATATALCTGVKTYNDSIGVGPNGEQLESIARQLQKEGWAVGVVTSVPISHATPGSAYSNNVSRDDYQDITRDLLGEASVAHRREPLPGVDVLIGTGWGVDAKDDSKQQGMNYVPGNKYLDEDTRKAVDVKHGGRYVVAERTPGQSGAESLFAGAKEAINQNARFFGYFGTKDGNLPFQTADGDYQPAYVSKEIRKKYEGLQRKYSDIQYSSADVEENPTLADMTKAALSVLEKKDKFWMMVEAGDVDWAMHANNVDNAIGAIYSGDDAFRAVVEWIEANDAWDDSAIILTADHGHMLVLEKPEAFAAP